MASGSIRFFDIRMNRAPLDTDTLLLHATSAAAQHQPTQPTPQQRQQHQVPPQQSPSSRAEGRRGDAGAHSAGYGAGVQRNIATLPQYDTASPLYDASLLQNNAASPEYDTASPRHDAAWLQNDGASPHYHTALPQDSAASPQYDAVGYAPSSSEDLIDGSCSTSESSECAEHLAEEDAALCASHRVQVTPLCLHKLGVGHIDRENIVFR